MKKIDAKGLACPKPVIMTKNELDKMESGIVETTVDNKVAVNNLSRLAKGQNFKYSVVTISEDEYIVTIEKDGDTVEKSEEGDDLVIGISSSTMGDGDEELGKILMKSFIYTVRETEPLPKSIIFYNGGVHLTCKNSPVIDDLQELSKEGVEIFSCGTCLDFYNLKDDLAVGEISNMYTIYESLKEAKKNLVIG